jgi:hypothetical protein
MLHKMTTIGVGSVFSGWQDSVVSLGANATFTTEIGMQRTSAELPKTSREEPLWWRLEPLFHSLDSPPMRARLPRRIYQVGSVQEKTCNVCFFSADSFRSYWNVPTSVKQGQCPKPGHPRTAAPRIPQKWVPSPEESIHEYRAAAFPQ